MRANGRASAVLRRLGATEEGRLRRSFLLGGEYHDDVLWSILAVDWIRQHRGSAPQQRPAVEGPDTRSPEESWCLALLRT
jgi:hypothetical protein